MGQGRSAHRQNGRLPIMDRRVPALLAMLYNGQTGCTALNETFSIQRGVRQGDVLSTLLFNAASESVLRRWKSKLTSHGIKLAVDSEDRLTNVRFADDLIVYANSFEELVEMVDLLVAEFAVVGLELNAKKSKIFTLEDGMFDCDSPVMVNVADGFMDVVRQQESHTYLGNSFSGDLRKRGKSVLTNRLRCAWHKFHSHRRELTNKHVKLELRIKLFKAVVVPTIMYGLIPAPLTAADLQKLCVAQRKMLRLMVGYTKLPEETWEDMHRRLKRKLADVVRNFDVADWEEELLERKQRYHTEVSEHKRCGLVQSVCAWDPKSVADAKLEVCPARKRGRPRTRWSQFLAAEW